MCNEYSDDSEEWEWVKEDSDSEEKGASDDPDTGNDAYRLNENLILLSDALTDAMYNAHRYRELGYEHQREDVLEEVEGIRDLAEEVLERYDDSEEVIREAQEAELVTRPGHPNTYLLTHFVCSEGHTVVEADSREKIPVSRTGAPRDTVACEECGTDYVLAERRTMIEKNEN